MDIRNLWMRHVPAADDPRTWEPRRRPSMTDGELLDWLRQHGRWGEGDCLVWAGPTVAQHKFGYPIIKYGKHGVHLHRLTYMLTKPAEDITGLVIRHTCDNPKCFNIKHLQPGTRIQNAQDATNRKRRKRGSTHPHAILTEAQVKTIRDLYATGSWRQVDLARDFNVTQTTISAVVRRASWQ